MNFWAELLPFALLAVTYAAPVLFAALGETISERAGVVNIGLEGLMLVGALASVIVAVTTHSPYLGALAALAASAALGAVFAFFSVTLRRDQVIVGTTINFLALGLTGVVFRAWLKNPGVNTTAPTLPILFLGQNALTLFALALVPAIHLLLFRTRLGLALRASGEKPAAAAASGYAVNRLRFLVCAMNGALCGLGGAALAIGINNTFAEDTVNSRGFVALAVVVFGRWNPSGALAAALLFAAADVGQARLQAQGKLAIPYPIFLAAPYLLTLLALAIRGARAKPPAALGEPFEQG